MKKALITGITGQDGSYLAEFLLGNGYEVHGLVRRSSAGFGALKNIKYLVDNPEIYRKTLFLHAGDLADGSSITRIISQLKPDELYNLAAQADVQESFLMPEYSLDINGTAVVRIIEAVRQFSPHTRVYQASTSELFGEVLQTPQNELTPFNPQSPYSIGKQAGFFAIKKYRQTYGLFLCNGILFNHESERRGEDYVTRKITKALARIKFGLQKELRLGNLNAHRDWGYSPEYVEAAWLMLQKDTPDDYVIGTGEQHTVQEWLDEALELAGLSMKNKMEHFVIEDPKLFRPLEVDSLLADPTKAKEQLGWEAKVKFHDLLRRMMEHDLALAAEEASRYGANTLS